MNENSQNYIGRNIKAIRINYGLNQEKFADLAGASQAAVSAWECGTSTPRKSSVAKIVSALPGLTADDVFSEESGFVAKTVKEATRIAKRIIDESESDYPVLDPVKSKLDASYELMNDETRELIANLAASIICDPKRRR